MAILTDGPNGPIKGKFGSVFAYVLKGQNIIRGSRRLRTKPPTDAELLNRKKTRITNDFLRMLFPVVKYGYKNLLAAHPTKNAANLAQSHVRKDCIELDQHNQPYVNPALFKPFRGELAPPQNASMQRVNDHLEISWDKGAGDSFIKLNILLYQIGEDIDLKIAIADTADGSCSIDSKLWGRPHDIHVYIGFTDTYRDILSDAVYLGVIDRS